MEHTNEFLARVFMTYGGNECQVLQENAEKYWHQKALLTGVKELAMVEVQHIYDTHAEEHANYYEFSECQLLLTPLALISDEDAIEVGKIILALAGGTHIIPAIDNETETKDTTIKAVNIGPDGHLLICYKDTCGLVLFIQDEYNEAQPIVGVSMVIDYLRSRGYDCGFAHIPSLIESGIAIKREGI